MREMKAQNAVQASKVDRDGKGVIPLGIAVDECVQAISLTDRIVVLASQLVGTGQANTLTCDGK